MRGDWQAAAKVTDISSETNTLRVTVDGKIICIYAIEAGICATQDRCPHGNASLSEGWVEDGTIECPLHQGVFDIRSGKPLKPPVDTDIEVYSVKVENGVIFVALQE